MPPDCEHKHPELPVTCGLDYDHKGNHRRQLKSGTVEWPQEVVEKVYTLQQLDSMIEQQADKLKVTLDAAGDGSRESDTLRTFIPIFQEQLFLIREVLKKVKSD